MKHGASTESSASRRRSFRACFGHHLALVLGIAFACRTSPDASDPTANEGGSGPGDAAGAAGGPQAGGGAGGGLSADADGRIVDGRTGGSSGSGGVGGGNGGSGGVQGADAASPSDGRSTSGDGAQAPRPALDATSDGQRSAGCGMAKPSEGNQAITSSGKARNYFLRLPKAYDSARPYPILFGFHGASRSAQDFVSDRGTYAFGPVAGEAAILVYPDALPDTQGTTSWTRDTRDDLAFFDAVLTALEAKLCVDTTRVFATGHSSGGFFTNALGCQRGGVVRAIGPVAGGLSGGSNCTQQPVAAILVHGTIDSMVSIASGQRARDYWVMRDGCVASAPMPAMPAPCVAYQACRPGLPVVWCQHDETAYAGTGHGWPRWATAAIWRFFEAL